MNIKKILVTNDDGVYADGIQILAKHLSRAGYCVLVCAPDRERSASGHSMTMDRPLHIKKVEHRQFSDGFEAYACDGTPTDSVIMGLEVLGFHADAVVSGINCGPNLGDDITYSGTACAAMEGVISGLPSIAVSLVCSPCDAVKNFGAAADAAVKLIEWIGEHHMEDGIFYNMNVPNLPDGAIKGVKMTRKGARRYRDKITVVKTPFGGEAYWVGGRIEDCMGEGTDVSAVRENYISITPVHLEMTSFSALSAANGQNMAAELWNRILDK